MSIRRIAGSLAFLLLVLCSGARAEAPDATAIVRAAIEYWRDVSSYAVFDMNIHRPDWQRSMSMRVWTRGNKESLVRVTAPAKDVGNGTLLLDNDMWSYNPKINRVIKIPSSMMNQSSPPRATTVTSCMSSRLCRTRPHRWCGAARW
jgi:outer membrane lipoprotein-sorting protein